MPDQTIAVKAPTKQKNSQKNLRAEIMNLKAIGKHEHIVDMLGWDEHWQPRGPAIFYGYCDLGDSWWYRETLIKAHGAVPEETIWKLFVDMAKALDYLHNQLTTPYIHGDFKPDNILVSRPRESFENTPILPTFKLADLSRASPYNGPASWFYGTPEYAAPLNERMQPLTPAIDIFGLGATLQSYALGILPTQHRQEWAQENPEEWNRIRQGAKSISPTNPHLRHYLPVVFRPLNTSPEDQVQQLGIKQEWVVPHYSNALNRWYAQCLSHDRSKRITADGLRRWMIPAAERRMAVLAAKQRANLLRQKRARLSFPLAAQLPSPPDSRADAFPYEDGDDGAAVGQHPFLKAPSRLLRRQGWDPRNSGQMQDLERLRRKYMKGIKSPFQ